MAPCVFSVAGAAGVAEVAVVVVEGAVEAVAVAENNLTKLN